VLMMRPSIVENVILDAFVAKIVAVDPVAVEKPIFFTVIWLDVIVLLAIVLTVREEPYAVDKNSAFVWMELVVRLRPTAVENARFALFTWPELESNTVMVDPVAVEKIRFFTVIWLDVIVPLFSVLFIILLTVIVAPTAVENDRF